MGKLRLFLKNDLVVVESTLKENSEVRIGKLGKNHFMIICMNDDLHKWIPLEEYENYIYDKVIDHDDY